MKDCEDMNNDRFGGYKVKCIHKMYILGLVLVILYVVLMIGYIKLVYCC